MFYCCCCYSIRNRTWTCGSSHRLPCRVEWLQSTSNSHAAHQSCNDSSYGLRPSDQCIVPDAPRRFSSLHTSRFVRLCRKCRGNSQRHRTPAVTRGGGVCNAWDLGANQLRNIIPALIFAKACRARQCTTRRCLAWRPHLQDPAIRPCAPVPVARARRNASDMRRTHKPGARGWTAACSAWQRA